MFSKRLISSVKNTRPSSHSSLVKANLSRKILKKTPKKWPKYKINSVVNYSRKNINFLSGKLSDSIKALGVLFYLIISFTILLAGDKSKRSQNLGPQPTGFYPQSQGGKLFLSV